MITAALIGNPNVGKTTLFNLLTASNQYVGNWPGVTVEKREGILNKNIKIVDLPESMPWIHTLMKKKFPRNSYKKKK